MLCQAGQWDVSVSRALLHILVIFPEFLDAEDVELVAVDVGQQPVRLPHRVPVGGPAAVPHQVHTVTCPGAQRTHL